MGGQQPIQAASWVFYLSIAALPRTYYCFTYIAH